MKTVTFAALAAVIIIPYPAFAHASLEKAEAENGGYTAVVRVPHGCDGKATHTVRLEIPEGFIGAKPMPKAGWELTLEKGDYAKTYMSHGSEVKSGLKAAIWSGGNLPDDQYDEFAVRGTLSDFEPGTNVYFKTTQLCDGGEVAWVDVPVDGQDPHNLKSPAPAVKITASGTDMHAHGHGATGAVAATSGETILGDLAIQGYWARAMLPNQPVAGGFLTITNQGGDDRMIKAASPRAGRMELHEMVMKGDVMEMREIEGGIAIAAGATVELKPGGLHVMFFDIAERFEEGQTVPVTLTFEKAGEVTLELPVKNIKDMQGHDMQGHKMDSHQHGTATVTMEGMTDIEQITAIMMGQFDTPENPLSVEPVVISGDHAIGSWSQNDKGGRALLRKANGVWTIHLCTGDAVKQAANLEKMGVPAADATVLADALAKEEAKLSAEKTALFDSFEGTVMIGGEGHGQHKHGG
jgi:uncharacterized protein YcnI/copper(I)-binding protein